MLWDSDQVLIAIHPLNISALLNGMISVKPALFNNSTARFLERLQNAVLLFLIVLMTSGKL